MFRKLDMFVAKLNKINEYLLVACLLTMFVVLLAQIFSRFIFFIPLPSSQDVLVFLLLTTVFLGAGCAVATHRHIVLEFMVLILPKKITRGVLIFSDLVSISFLVIVIGQSFELIEKTRGTIIGASPVPAEGYYAVVAAGCLMMAINYVNDLLKKLQNSPVHKEEK